MYIYILCVRVCKFTQAAGVLKLLIFNYLLLHISWCLSRIPDRDIFVMRRYTYNMLIVFNLK